jgi:hypothetical protein
VCKACSKKNRPCSWDPPQNKFREYKPETLSNDSVPADNCEADSEAMDVDGSEGSQVSRTISPGEHEARRDSRPESNSGGPSSANPSASSGQPSPDFPNTGSGSTTRSGGQVTVASLLRLELPRGTRHYSQLPIPLTHGEALLVHHYTEHLGRWLDCTDATRQFTLGVPQKVKQCPVLCHAVLCFAARHRRDDATAQAAYQRCIAVLIDRLNERTASHDETLLCAIVILRFYEQLSGIIYPLEFFARTYLTDLSPF